MGKLIGKHIIGAVGPLIYRLVNGEIRVSARPVKGTIKQSPATKLAFNTFGAASSLSKAIRTAFVNHTNGFTDSYLHGRVVSLLSKVLNDSRDKETLLYHFETSSFATLNNLEFNLKSPFRKTLLNSPIALVTGRNITIFLKENFTEKELKFPRDTFYCKIKVSVALFRLNEGLALQTPHTQEITLRRNQGHLPEQELSFDLPDGCLCIATVFIQFSEYSDEGGLGINNKKFNPGKVIKALITPGIYIEKDNEKWIEMKAIPTS